MSIRTENEFSPLGRCNGVNTECLIKRLVSSSVCVLITRVLILLALVQNQHELTVFSIIARLCYYYYFFFSGLLYMHLYVQLNRSTGVYWVRTLCVNTRGAREKRYRFYSAPVYFTRIKTTNHTNRLQHKRQYYLVVDLGKFLENIEKSSFA